MFCNYSIASRSLKYLNEKNYTHISTWYGKRRRFVTNIQPFDNCFLQGKLAFLIAIALRSFHVEAKRFFCYGKCEALPSLNEIILRAVEEVIMHL